MQQNVVKFQSSISGRGGNSSGSGNLEVATVVGVEMVVVLEVVTVFWGAGLAQW